MPNATALRYPGGKARLRPYVEALIEQNSLQEINYVEPFCGGAGLALELLFGFSVDIVHLNDFDRSVFAYWHSVLKNNELFCEKISETPCDMHTWYAQREIWQNRENSNLFDLGFATFFLNRTNRSGILGAGVIGGKKQDGKWKIDARYNKGDLISRVLKVGEFKSKIFLYNLEAKYFLRSIVPSLPENSLVYLDPPYVEKGPGLYLNHYQEVDHRQLAEQVITELKHPWMVSYDDHPLIRECYGASEEVKMSLPYSAHGNAKRGNELFFFSANLKPPKMPEKKYRYGKPWKKQDAAT
jgi:DNA adenine methylase